MDQNNLIEKSNMEELYFLLTPSNKTGWKSIDFMLEIGKYGGHSFV
jgi:hypothetical protein